MNNKLLFIPQWHTSGTISTPETNYKSLYPKANDNYWYFVDSDGSEKRIETALDIRNGITTTTYATSSLFRARLDVALGLGLTFSGNFAGSTISVFEVTTDMLSSINTGTAGYVLTSNGSSFNWVPTASITNNINGTADKIAKYSSSTTLGDSLITDDGVKLVIGVTPSFAVGLMNVDGSMYLSGYLYLTDSLNTYIRYSNGIEIQTDEDIIFRDELGYNYLDMKTDNISSYTFSILESTLLLGDNGTFSYLVADDIDSVSFGSTLSTMTFSMISNTPGVLRLKDTSEGVNKVFVSDSDGYGRWQNLGAGSGLTVSGITYSVRLGGTGLTISSSALTLDYSIFGSTLTHSAGLVDLNTTGITAGVYGTSGVSVQLTVDSYGRITNIGFYTQSVGLTGPVGVTGATGTAGATGPSVNYDNGLEIIGGTVSLGGTISKLTIIDTQTQSFAIINVLGNSFSNYSGLAVEGITTQVGYFYSSGTTSRLLTSDTSISIESSNGINQFQFGFNQNQPAFFTDTFYNKGLEYSGSYSGNFTTHSLVDKYYVDTQIASLTFSGNGITEVIAGQGLTGGGTSSSITLNSNVSNGLSINNDFIVLGGTLSATTSINTNVHGFFIGGSGNIGLTSSSNLDIESRNYTTFLVTDPTTELSAGLLLSTVSNVFADSISSMGLRYLDDYTANFVTHSLITKGYLETTTSNYLPLSGGTVSGKLTVTGSTVLSNLTASNTYISSTGSTTLTLYSSGTGSTIFRVQGTSGELFSVVDGLTGSLFSVNNISGLPILEVFSDDTILMGDYVAPSLNSTVKVTTMTGSNIIYSIDKSLYTGAFFEYTVSKDTNARAGSILSVWNGITASYTETSTTDIGLTTDITFLVSATGSDAILTASASSNNWIIKTIIRSI